LKEKLSTKSTVSGAKSTQFITNRKLASNDGLDPAPLVGRRWCGVDEFFFSNTIGTQLNRRQQAMNKSCRGKTLISAVMYAVFLWQ